MCRIWTCAGHFLRAHDGSLHALGEPRPAWGGAPWRGETPSQEWQGLLAREGASAVLPPAPWAPNAGRQARWAAGAERRLSTVAVG